MIGSRPIGQPRVAGSRASSQRQAKADRHSGGRTIEQNLAQRGSKTPPATADGIDAGETVVERQSLLCAQPRAEPV